MPAFGLTDSQITHVVAFISGLDGGLQQSKPLVTFAPETPVGGATITVRFNGTQPSSVTALPVMQMGTGTMQTAQVTLAPSPSDPHVFAGKIIFSMSGPWIVRIRYGDQTLDVPINVGS